MLPAPGPLLHSYVSKSPRVRQQIFTTRLATSVNRKSRPASIAKPLVIESKLTQVLPRGERIEQGAEIFRLLGVNTQDRLARS
jgi:hypothetical protein